MELYLDEEYGGWGVGGGGGCKTKKQKTDQATAKLIGPFLLCFYGKASLASLQVLTGVLVLHVGCFS